MNQELSKVSMAFKKYHVTGIVHKPTDSTTPKTCWVSHKSHVCSVTLTKVVHHDLCFHVYTALRPGVISVYNKHHKPCIQKDTIQPCCCHIAGHMQHTCHTAINQTLNKSTNQLMFLSLESSNFDAPCGPTDINVFPKKYFLKQIPYACLHNCSMHLCVNLSHLNVMRMTYVMRRYTSSQHH